MIITKLKDVSDISEMLDSRSRIGKDCFKGRVCFVKSHLLKIRQKEVFINCFKVFEKMINGDNELEAELTILFLDEDNKKHIYHNVGVVNKENLGETIYMTLDTIKLKLASAIIDVYIIDNEGKRGLAESFLIIVV